MIDLQECRNEIDKIDSDIIRLFEQRMKVCEDVAEYKIRTGKKVLDPERERQKLEVLRGKAHGEFNQLGAQELFQQIMAISRKRQYQLLTEHGIEDDEKRGNGRCTSAERCKSCLSGCGRCIQLCCNEGIFPGRY